MSNFYRLLEILHASDSALEDLTALDFKELIGNLNGKIDAIQDVRSRIKSESDRLKNIGNDYAIKVTRLNNSLKKLDNYILDSMDQHNMPYLEGGLYSVRVQSRKSVEFNLEDPGVLEALKYPDLTKKTFAWDKKKVKDDLVKGTELGFAKMVSKNHIVFRIKKGK